MTGPRDWDKDLAAVDKAIESWKATTPGTSPGSAKAAPVVVAAAKEPAKGAMATWLRVLLVLAFAIAVPFWPYPRGCGINLFLYLGVISLLVVAGLWGAASSWGRRLGNAHILSLLTVVWGLALLAAEVLPRIGYAAHQARWMCP
ncbi:MAG: putative rane protein [Gemmatimonadetes bacterium]|nr:putative rane protein [Gemmatimonadota bacterium]